MAPTISIFSRRKNSDDKTLKSFLLSDSLISYTGSNTCLSFPASSADSPAKPVALSPGTGIGETRRLGSPTPKWIRKGKKGKDLEKEKNPTTKANLSVIPVTAEDPPGLATASPPLQKRTVISESPLPFQHPEESGTATPQPKSSEPSQPKKPHRRKSSLTNSLQTLPIATPALAHSFQPPCSSLPVARHCPTPPRPSMTLSTNPAQQVSISLSSGVGILPNELPNPLPSLTPPPSDSPRSAPAIVLSKLPTTIQNLPTTSNGKAPSPTQGPVTHNRSPHTSVINSINFSSRESLQTPPESPEDEESHPSSITPLGIRSPPEIVSDLATNLSGNVGSSQSAHGGKHKETEDDMKVELAALKKALATREEIISRLNPTLSSFAADGPQPQSSISPNENLSEPELRQVNKTLSRRIRELEKVNNEKEEVITRHASKFHSLRQSHNTLVEMIRLSHDQEVASLKENIKNLEMSRGVTVEDLEDRRHLKRRERELLAALNEREEEVESYRRDTNELRGKIIYIEKLMAEREGKLRVAENKIKRLSELEPPLLRGGGENSDDNLEREQRIMQEIRKREAAEQELDQTILRHKKEVEEALVIERDQARKILAERIAEERKKRNDLKGKMWREFEVAMEDQEEKQREYETRLTEEEKLRTGLQKELATKISEFENQTKQQTQEFETELTRLKESESNLLKENANLAAKIEELETLLDQDKRIIASIKAGHEDAMMVTKRITERLTEEKKRNRQFEAAFSSLTHGAAENGSEVEVLVLKGHLEDKENTIRLLQTELAAWKSQFQSVGEAGERAESEARPYQTLIQDKEERIRDLEMQIEQLSTRDNQKEEVKCLCATLSVSKSTEISKSSNGNDPSLQSSILGLGLVIGGDDSAGDADGIASKEGDAMAQMQVELAELNKEIVLYKQDVKGYRRDVKRRDVQIINLVSNVQRLESIIEEKIQEVHKLEDALQIERRIPSNASTFGGEKDLENLQIIAGKISSVKDENLQLKQLLRQYQEGYKVASEESEALKKKFESFVAQHGVIIEDLESRLAKVVKEKEDLQRRLRKSTKEREKSRPLPPLPAEAAAIESPMKPSLNVRRASSRRHSSSPLNGSAFPLAAPSPKPVIKIDTQIRLKPLPSPLSQRISRSGWRSPPVTASLPLKQPTSPLRYAEGVRDVLPNSKEGTTDGEGSFRKRHRRASTLPLGLGLGSESVDRVKRLSTHREEGGSGLRGQALGMGGSEGHGIAGEVEGTKNEKAKERGKEMVVEVDEDGNQVVFW